MIITIKKNIFMFFESSHLKVSFLQNNYYFPLIFNIFFD